MLQRTIPVLRRQVARSAPTWRSTRLYATKAETKTTTTTASSRIERFESRLPNFLRRFTVPLRQAPLSHITAFLILHEITALVPLFGLTAIFHYTEWLPPYISEGKWVSEGTRMFGNWLRKQGWIDAQDDRRSRWWGRGESGTRIVVELATAYAVTKALLPLRLPLSVWLTPWFARWSVLPVTRRLTRLFRKSKTKQAPAPVAGEKVSVQDIKLPSKNLK